MISCMDNRHTKCSATLGAFILTIQDYFGYHTVQLTVSTCTSCTGDNARLECPVNTSHWEKNNRTVCDEPNCNLGRVSKDDLGFYQCAEYGIVLAVGKFVRLHNIPPKL